MEYMRVTLPALLIVQVSTLIYGAAAELSSAAASSNASPTCFKYTENTWYVSSTDKKADIFCAYGVGQYGSAGFYRPGADLPSILGYISDEPTTIAINNDVHYLECNRDCLPFSDLDRYLHYFPRVQSVDLNQVTTNPRAVDQQPKAITLNAPCALSFNAAYLYTPRSFDWEENILPWSNTPVIPRTFDLRGLDVSALLPIIQAQGLGQGVTCIVDYDENKTYDLPSQRSLIRTGVDFCYAHRYKIAAAVALGLALKNINTWYPHIIKERLQALSTWRDAITQQETQIAYLQSIMDYARGAAEGNFTKEQIYHACMSIAAEEAALCDLNDKPFWFPFGKIGMMRFLMMTLYRYCKPIGVAVDFGYSACASLIKTWAMTWYMHVCCNFAGYRPYVQSAIIPVKKEDQHYQHRYESVLATHYGDFQSKYMTLHPDDAAPMVATNRKIAACLVGVPTILLAGLLCLTESIDKTAVTS